MEEGVRKHIYLPDYICDSVYKICQKAGFKFSFYSVNDDLTVNLNRIRALIMERSVILFVNYFGIVDNQQAISQLKREIPNMIVVLDNVQAPYKMREDTDADFCFTSLRKSFPLPDGAVVATERKGLRQYDQTAKFSEYKIAASILKSYKKHGYYNDDIYLELYRKGEDLVTNDISKAPSKFTIENWPKIDISRMAYLRRRNAKVILNGLTELGISPICQVHKDDVPLFLPIAIRNRNKLRKAMFAQNIFLPIHWPIADEMREKMPHGSYLADQELSIIVDPRYTEDDMNRILQVLRENI
jgi:hypothetical protein